MVKAFITGATGFIGGWVARQLLERGYSIVCLVRSPDSAASRRLDAQGATLVQGDIIDAETMREAMAPADIVFHIARYVYVNTVISILNLYKLYQGILHLRTTLSSVAMVSFFLGISST